MTFHTANILSLVFMSSVIRNKVTQNIIIITANDYNLKFNIYIHTVVII